jgi:hypothetical protein
MTNSELERARDRNKNIEEWDLEGHGLNEALLGQLPGRTAEYHADSSVGTFSTLAGISAELPNTNIELTTWTFVLGAECYFGGPFSKRYVAEKWSRNHVQFCRLNSARLYWRMDACVNLRFLWTRRIVWAINVFMWQTWNSLKQKYTYLWSRKATSLIIIIQFNSIQFNSLLLMCRVNSKRQLQKQHSVYTT